MAVFSHSVIFFFPGLDIHEPVRIQGQKEGDVLNLDIYKFKELN